jgi:GDP-L-fucose synthase
MNPNKNTKIYVAGHRGMVGSAIIRQLQAKGFNNLITKTYAELDLTNQQAVKNFFQEEKSSSMAFSKFFSIRLAPSIQCRLVYLESKTQ